MFPVQAEVEIDAQTEYIFSNERFTVQLNSECPVKFRLIESEAFKELQQTHGITLDYSQSRRNVVTRGIDLNSLVGQTFQVGKVTLTGMRLCEPCTYLSSLTGHSKLVKQWRGRAGLRAHIAQGGELSVGDKIATDS